MTMKRSWDMLSKEKKQQAVREIIAFFKNEREEEIGIIAAEAVLDHFLQNIGLQLYNKGVKDSIALLTDRVENLELDIKALIKE